LIWEQRGHLNSINDRKVCNYRIDKIQERWWLLLVGLNTLELSVFVNAIFDRKMMHILLSLHLTEKPWDVIK